MPVTLAQAKLNVQDDLQAEVIDEYAKSNFMFSKLPIRQITKLYLYS